MSKRAGERQPTTIDETRPYAPGATGATATALAIESAQSSDGADQTQSLQVEIEQTRSEISETITALQEKLNPQTLMDQAKETVRDTAADVMGQAKDTVREATIGKAEQMLGNASETARGAGASLMETIKQNPVPIALAAVGLGWLWMKRAQTAPRDQPRYPAYGSQAYDNRPARYETPGTGSDTLGQVQDKAGQVATQVQDMAGQVAGQTQDAVSGLVEGTHYHAHRAQGQAQRLLQETPLAAGAIALALGAGVGLALPETPQEHQLLGQARDTLMDTAMGTAQDTLDMVGSVAQKAESAIKEEAQAQGLSR